MGDPHERVGSLHYYLQFLTALMIFGFAASVARMDLLYITIDFLDLFIHAIQ